MLIPMHVSLNFAITQFPEISKLDRLLKDAPPKYYIFPILYTKEISNCYKFYHLWFPSYESNKGVEFNYQCNIWLTCRYLEISEKMYN